ncbi:MAG: aromatic ring-hydroxylating dioxygenase subunit alpha [Pseudomonadota bacterium]
MTAHDLDLQAVTQPVAAARGLPNGFYTDPEMHRQEKAKLFFAHWAGLGFAHEVANPGDVRPISYLGQPLMMVRDRTGALKVFYNVCRHRGMKLIEEAGNLPRAIRCPYHSWCYELDGRLRTTPHVGGPGRNRHDEINREDLGLVEVRSAEWLGVVWINLDGKAPPFEEWAGHVRNRWSEFQRPVYACGPEGDFTLEVQSNWKLAVENFCESYHLPWVHPGLNSYSRLEDHYHIEELGAYSGQGTLVYRPMLAEDGKRFPDFPDLSGKWNEGAEYIALYPNVLLGVHRDHTVAIILEPQSHHHTLERVAVLYTDPEVAGDKWSAMRHKNAAQWREVFEEDIFVVEGMQKGRHAEGFDGGKFSPAMDGPTHCFHHWVASEMQR